jgi:hypothetical protein
MSVITEVTKYEHKGVLYDSESAARAAALEELMKNLIGIAKQGQNNINPSHPVDVSPRFWLALHEGLRTPANRATLARLLDF